MIIEMLFSNRTTHTDAKGFGGGTPRRGIRGDTKLGLRLIERERERRKAYRAKKKHATRSLVVASESDDSTNNTTISWWNDGGGGD